MKKGFTLIELLAVIVILAIIALIATPIVLNIINSSKSSAKERSIGLYKHAVETSVMSYQAIHPEIALKGAFTSSSDGKTLTQGTNEITVEYTGNTVKCTTITMNDKGKLEYTGCSVDGNAGSSTTAWIYIDADNDGTKNVGDKITFGTESFYIISNDGTNIKALAEYNLNVGNNPVGGTETGLQDEDAKIWLKSGTSNSTTTFSSDSQKGANYSDYTGSIVEQYVNAYKIKLEGMGATIKSVGLITKEQLETLGCFGGIYNCDSNLSWIYTTMYWTGSAYTATHVWYAHSNGYFTCDDYAHAFGVRPVINISSSEI